MEIQHDRIVLGVTQTVTKSVIESVLLRIKDGDSFVTGEQLTHGPIDVKEYKDIVGELEAQRYIVSEVNKVYAGQ